MVAFLINIIISIVWLLLSKEPGIIDFTIGYAVGFALILPFSNLVNGEAYFKRIKGVLSFVFIFLGEFIKSNLSVAYMILFVPKDSIKPGFFNYELGDMGWFESILLSYCITLTPGTISVKLIREENTLIVHSLDSTDLESIKEVIDLKFKRSILRFTR